MHTTYKHNLLETFTEFPMTIEPDSLLLYKNFVRERKSFGIKIFAVLNANNIYI